MSKTYKIQRAYQAHKTEFDDYSMGTNNHQAIDEAFRDTGRRFGDQRKMRAKLKVSNRRIERKKNNRESEKIIRESGSE